MDIKSLRYLTIIILGYALMACGGDSSQFFTRTNFAGHQFPLDSSPVVTSMKLTQAFPNLTFSLPLFLTYSPDGTNRLFVVEQGGVIYVFDNDTDTSTKTVFLDVSDEIETAGSEQGLLGLAFDPDFQTNGYFYINKIMPSPERTVVSRYKVSATNSNVADASSEQVILSIEQPFANHNGGHMNFGSDGMLYIGVGDGGSANDPLNSGQDRTTLLGSILRINPVKTDGQGGYTIPADNPYAGNSDGFKEEIWAYGLRNPWRFSFDRVTGSLYVGDVGQAHWEEISVVTKGANMGWKICEGFQLTGSTTANDCDTSFSSDYGSPLFNYANTGSASVTGGYVYRGDRLPFLNGVYVYADFVSGEIYGLTLGDSSTNTLLASGSAVSSFGEDQNGEVFILNYGDGKIYQLSEQDSVSDDAGFPQYLSQTGLFSNVSELQVVDGVEFYEINSPLWSDGSTKKRWMALPSSGQITFDAEAAWQFPVSTVFIKHFDLAIDSSTTKKLETRILLHQNDRWIGYTYQWNDAQTDAELLTSSQNVDYAVVRDGSEQTITWTYPGPSDCLTCHTSVSGRVLGAKTKQLHQSVDSQIGQANQLFKFNDMGLFTSDIGTITQYEAYPQLDDTSKDLTERVKAYLASNCSMCHQPSGTTPVNIDMRFETALNDMNLLDVDPTQGEYGLSSPKRIKAGSKEQSILWHRMQTTTVSDRMPPLSNHPDEDTVEVMGTWIDGLE